MNTYYMNIVCKVAMYFTCWCYSMSLRVQYLIDRVSVSRPVLFCMPDCVKYSQGCSDPYSGKYSKILKITY